MTLEELLHKDITDGIISAFYKVYSTLGYGFLEQVYENAMFLELVKAGYSVERQKSIRVFYEGEQVGYYIADMIVNDAVIIEIKAMEGLVVQHEYQLINYLRATDIEVGLLINFGKKPQFKRKIYSNQ
ncbi:GxxExxY protein [Lunatimonas salinarum]|uniref:GxxExxY protein n=1 Tax=Lunatimonas salinarum TaxID=1774590 RepID=UPI001AE0689D|nr:GxxExxY protein [Lunatimonas salinarum]